MIEIVQRETCPKCRGRGTVTAFRLKTNTTGKKQCSDCHGDGTVPRTLATFADAAVLLAVMLDAVGEGYSEGIDYIGSSFDEEYSVAAVLAALGVTNDQS